VGERRGLRGVGGDEELRGVGERRGLRS